MAKGSVLHSQIFRLTILCCGDVLQYQYLFRVFWVQNNEGGMPTVGVPPYKVKKRISVIYLY